VIYHLIWIVKPLIRFSMVLKKLMQSNFQTCIRGFFVLVNFQKILENHGVLPLVALEKEKAKLKKKKEAIRQINQKKLRKRKKKEENQQQKARTPKQMQKLQD